MRAVDIDASEFLTWQSADRTRTVRLSHDLIRKLHIEIMRGFGVTRRRGTEPGGILLGRNEGDSALVIDSFEVVPCEYKFGPSYVLSPEEQPLFAAAVARAGTAAVGFFRSHTRGGLTLDHADVDLFMQHLRGNGKVALVLKPFATKPASASLFFPDAAGRLHAGESPHEFTFSPRVDIVVAEPDASPAPVTREAPPRAAAAAVVSSAPTRKPEHEKLLTGVLGLRTPTFDGIVKADEPVVDEDAPTSSEQRKHRGFLTLLSAILFTAAALTTGFVAGVQVAGGRVSLTPLAVQTVDPAAALQLGLRAQPAGDRVRVQWNTDSAAARQANSATLYIQEGNDSRVVPLRPEEVRDGSVLHLPQEATVRFRLELILNGGRTVTETAEWKR